MHLHCLKLIEKIVKIRYTFADAEFIFVSPHDCAPIKTVAVAVEPYQYHRKRNSKIDIFLEV